MKGIILAGGVRNTTVPGYPRSQQAAFAGLRQTHDLLSPFRLDALRNSGHPDYIYPTGPALI
jgi:hypothetical protein